MATGKRGVSPIWLQKSIPPTFYFGNMLELIVMTSEKKIPHYYVGVTRAHFFQKRSPWLPFPPFRFVARMHIIVHPTKKNHWIDGYLINKLYFWAKLVLGKYSSM